MAVATPEQSAESVSFQQHQPSQPPVRNVDSAPCSLTSARQFGGKSAQNANFVQNVHHLQIHLIRYLRTDFQ
jgi:hypothetical protein